ncbi:MAG: 30S ribosomal protein S1, partial [Thermoanaerobaculia bacterium]
MPASENEDQSLLTAEPEEERNAEEYRKLLELYDESMRNLTEGEIVTGRVIGITANAVIVDVGYKSEGLIPIEEFTDRGGDLSVRVGEDVDVLLEKTEDLEGHILLSFTKAQRMRRWTEVERAYKEGRVIKGRVTDRGGGLLVNVGEEVDVLLEKTEDLEGHVLLSYQKAQRMRRWTEVERAYKEGRIIKGRITDRIKGGLTVDVGLRAFLPGSLVDIKPVKNLESLRGQELEFKVISLDRRRNNIVLSRKAVLETELVKKKAETLKRLEEGARLRGTVKNITDYGVFIDLGGIDGLLHITDISWGRVNHPSEHFTVGDEVEVVVLKFDPETERVSLGYKQRSDDPWTLVDKKYPIGSRVKGRVVSIVDYG